MFVIVAREHKETDEVVDRIINYQNYPKKTELKRYLQEMRNNMDDRFFSILNYSKYLILKNGNLSLNDKLMNEISERVKLFNTLLQTGKLITFIEGADDRYFNMLYSTKDLLQYSIKKITKVF